MFVLVQSRIEQACDEIKSLILKKNADYGDSVFTSPPLAPNVSVEEAIRVRIGDKIKRLQTLYRKQEAMVEETVSDTEKDLAGYLILLQVARERNKND